MTAPSPHRPPLLTRTAIVLLALLGSASASAATAHYFDGSTRRAITLTGARGGLWQRISSVFRPMSAQSLREQL